MNKIVFDAISNTPKNWKMHAEILRRKLVTLGLTSDENEDIRPEEYEEQQYQGWLLALQESLVPFVAP